MTRRSKSEIDTIKRSIYEYCKLHQPLTVRQLFYAMTVQKLIDKTEGEYKQTICRLTKDMRLSGELPWHWLADNTRWMRKPVSYGSMEDCLDYAAQAYRRNLWTHRDEYVEVWLEKDALSGVLMDVTRKFDVPLMVTRGYPSLSYLRSAAETIAETNKATSIYYFGDFDPSGVDISRNVEERLREFVEELAWGWLPDFTFDRVAVNEPQIEEWNLPTRPTKSSDSRAARFGTASVELDSIPPDTLRGLVKERLNRHVSDAELDAAAEVDQLERETLKSLRLYLPA